MFPIAPTARFRVPGNSRPARSETSERTSPPTSPPRQHRRHASRGAGCEEGDAAERRAGAVVACKPGPRGARLAVAVLGSRQERRYAEREAARFEGNALSRAGAAGVAASRIEITRVVAPAPQLAAASIETARAAGGAPVARARSRTPSFYTPPRRVIKRCLAPVQCQIEMSGSSVAFPPSARGRSHGGRTAVASRPGWEPPLPARTYAARMRSP